MDSLLSIKSSSEISNGLSHSLEDSSLPPSFSRLPPDGHEFPPNYQEPSRITSNSMTSDPSLNKSSESKTIMDSPPNTPPPPLPTSCPPQKDLSEAAPAPGKPLPPPPPARKPPPKDFNSRLPPRPSGERRHWMKDEKSEKSVRDKIAMFQRENKEDAPPPVTSAPPIPAARSPFKLDATEERSRKGLTSPQWGEDTRGRSHLSRSMINVDGTGRNGDHTSPALYPPSNLYKGGVHNSTGDVSAGMEGVDGSRTLDFARTRSNLDLTSSSNSCSPDSSLSSASSYSSGGVYATLPRKPIATQRPPVAAERKTSVLENRPSSPDSSSWKTPTYSPSNRSGNLHSRSQSLIDVGSPKRHSFAGSYNYKYGINGNDEARKSSLNAMIEQRRRNVSKLRGLVIPEKTEVARCDQSLFDLPEIKSRDAIIINDKCKTATLPRCESKQTNKWSENMNGHSAKSQNNNNFANSNSNNGVTLSSPPWKSQAPLPDLPKYSPAFKRRTLSVHGLSPTSLDSSREELRSQEQSKLHPPSKPPRTSNGYGIGPSSPLGPEPKSLESITSPRSDSSFDFSPMCHADSPKEEEVVPVIKTNGGTGSYGDSHNGKSIHRGLLHVPSRGASAEDSDNDSAVSSSRSSISHGFSPPSSPLPGDTSDGGLRPSAPRQHISRDRLQSEDRSRLSTSQRRSSGNIVERANSPEKRPLRRTLSSETTASVSSAASTASTVTSGSHDGGNASDSSSNRRVLKAQSVEAINRKNVLASAKYSSGRDLKVGSPLIKRKFEEDGSGTEADVEDTAKAESSRTNGSERISMHYKTTREINGIHDIEATRNMDIKVAYVDEIIEFPFVNGAVDCSVPIPAQRRIYTSPRPTSPVSEYSTTESVCDSHKEDKKSEAKGLDEIESATEEIRTPKTSPSVPLDRWMELEKKYAPKMSPMETRTSMEAQESPYKGHILEDEIDYLSRNVGGDSEKSRVKSLAEKQKDTGNGFRAIAEKWQIISNDASTLPSPTNPVAAVTTSSAASNGQSRKNSRRSSTSGADTSRVSPETAHPKAEEPLRIPPPPESAPPPVPHSNGEATHSEAVRLREKKSPVARPVSFNGCGEKTLSVSSAYTIQETRTTMSRQESTPEPRTPPSPAPAPLTAAQRASNRRSVSVNDIRKAFEKVELSVAANGKTSSVTRTKGTAVTTVHTRVSSLDSTTSEDSSMQTPAHYGSANNLASNHRDQFGSVTSLASSTSLISPQVSVIAKILPIEFEGLFQ
ncbi:hypothetical protein J437_LFUL009369 [Ladona fulva]|uniref:Uncharacterized protein n=1 Tax=Ladona fulva TaxID=123851 RepID=A0A8K0K4P6_LADFU|nr:hypothetical protein J437_LFUL009369 [Ladona fulva]